MIYWFLYTLLCIYCILDYYHTIALVSFGMEEINPIVLWIIGPDYNWRYLLYTKVVSLAVLGALLIIKQVKDKTGRC